MIRPVSGNVLEAAVCLCQCVHTGCWYPAGGRAQAPSRNFLLLSARQTVCLAVAYGLLCKAMQSGKCGCRQYQQLLSHPRTDQLNLWETKLQCLTL